MIFCGTRKDSIGERDEMQNERQVDKKYAFELWNGLSILVGKHTEMLRSRVNSFLRWLQSSQNNESGSGGGKRLVLWGGKGKGRVKQGNENTIQLFFEVKI